MMACTPNTGHHFEQLHTQTLNQARAAELPCISRRTV
jgi:hypothetical protein